MATYVNVDKKLLTRLIEKGPYVENFGKWNGAAMPCLFIQSSNRTTTQHGVKGCRVNAVAYVDGEFLEFSYMVEDWGVDGYDFGILSPASADTVSCKRVIPVAVTSWMFQDA